MLLTSLSYINSWLYLDKTQQLYATNNARYINNYFCLNSASLVYVVSGSQAYTC